MGMKAAHLQLPPGTSIVIDDSRILLMLDWTGQAGRHIICLDQAIEGTSAEERDESANQAILLFRNVVGFEIIDDALNSGEGMAPAA